MPKLRNGGNDVEKLAQWFGRKCRNHNPLEELGVAKANTRANMYKAKSKGDLGVVKEEKGTVVYHSSGRAFEIKIQEVDPEKYKAEQLEAVGY
jgi:ribosomal protein L16 Arg81 hydroxylase